MTLSWIVWFPAMRMTGTYHQIYAAELGATAAILGMISAVSTIVISLSRIPGGYIADRYGRKRIVVSMTFIVASTYLIYAFAPSWEWILIGAVIANMALIYQPALFALRADSVPPEKRGVSFASMDFLANLTCLPAPLIAAYLVATYDVKGGMRIAYIIAATLGIVAALIRLLLKETLSKKRKKANDENILGVGEDFRREYIDALRFIFKNLPGLTIFYLLFSFAFMGIFPFLSYYAVYFLGLTKETWGYVYFLSQLIYLFTLLPIGFFVDKIGRKSVLMAIVMLSVLGAATCALASRASFETVIYVFTGLSIMMVSQAAFSTSLSALEADVVPREKRGRTSAVLGLVTSFSAAAGQTFVGFAYENIDPRFPFFVATFVLMAAFTIVFLLVKEPKHREL